MENRQQHIGFIDWVRCVACLMVILVHSCEYYYIGEEGLRVASESDGMWVTWIDSLLRCAVPLFVMVSGYLLLPVADPLPVFFRKRLTRVVVPFLLWSVLYAALPAMWSQWDAPNALSRLLVNFADNAGHLWFVYMIIGVYMIMPVVSPWLERCSRREEQLYLVLWALSMFFPYIRYFCGYIYGEGAWNEFNTLWYFSGFLGYAILGHYLRRYVSLSRARALAVGLPMIAVGYVVTALVFAHMLTVTTDLGTLELSWRFCTPNVAMVALGFFLIFSTIGRGRRTVFATSLPSPTSASTSPRASSSTHPRASSASATPDASPVRVVANLTYGMYLMHIFVLNEAYRLLSPHFSTPVSILLIAASTYLVCIAAAWLLSRLPGGKYIVG